MFDEDRNTAALLCTLNTVVLRHPPRRALCKPTSYGPRESREAFNPARTHTRRDAPW